VVNLLQPIDTQNKRFQTTMLVCGRLFYIYSAIVLLWFVSRLFLGDRFWWLYVINSLALYLFIPLPVMWVLSYFLRKKLLHLLTILITIIGLQSFGLLFLPKIAWVRPSSTGFSVMTYNVFGYNDNISGVLDSIKSSGADVVAIQELSHDLAEALETDLVSDYPHQVLRPHADVCGMGIISKFPIGLVQSPLKSPNCVQYQFVELDVDGTVVLLLNFHAISPRHNLDKRMIARTIPIRESQAGDMAEVVRKQSDPVIVAGDLNATDRNSVYRILSKGLEDVWLEGGWGPGHTFPGDDSPRSSRPKIMGRHVPKWLFRIDYIFHSKQLRTKRAWIGPWDGKSDHRPVVARLSIPGR
jgi:endonuclease/exonuclease/phosphatase (EEP) superfamily protein YafD